jgi:hypothetical protein
MKVTFVISTEDDTTFRVHVELPSVPRKGESIVLTGDEFGGPRKYGNESSFVVDHVAWVIDTKTHGVHCSVDLKLDRNDEQCGRFEPRCTCAPTERILDMKKLRRCDNCGYLAWWDTRSSAAPDVD